MNFYIYREITHDNPGESTYQQIGATRFREDADYILSQWHAGYIVHAGGEIVFQKNLSEVPPLEAPRNA